MWGKNIRVVIVPLILAFAFLGASNLSSLLTGTFCWFYFILFYLSLATWLASITPRSFLELDGAVPPAWSFPLGVTGLGASMCVNALVTGLIVFRIFKVLQQVKLSIPDQQNLGVTGGRKLYSIISVIIESGMILFSIQLARFVVTVVQTDAADDAFQIIVCVHEILNVIIRFSYIYFLLLILSLVTRA